MFSMSSQNHAFGTMNSIFQEKCNFCVILVLEPIIVNAEFLSRASIFSVSAVNSENLVNYDSTKPFLTNPLLKTPLKIRILTK